MFTKKTKRLKTQLEEVAVLIRIFLLAIVDDVEKRFDQDDAGGFTRKDIAEFDIIAENMAEINVKQTTVGRQHNIGGMTIT